MKAFSCPQCGALLQNFSIEQNIARCDYCGAKILIRPLGEINPKTGEEEFEISLVTRAESGVEEKETYSRGKFTFTKNKYQVNESLKEIFDNKKEKKPAYFLPLIVSAIIIFILAAAYLNLAR